jgi:tol-pal system protein YbgF
MRFRAFILLLIPAACFAANKETQELQRDVALMQEDIRTLQRSFDQQMAALRTLTQQAVDNSNRIATSVGVLSQSLPDQIKREMGTAVAPVAGVSSRLDQVGSQVQQLADAMQALNNSVQQLHTQMNDLANVVKAIQAPPPAPPPTDPNSTSLTVPGGGTASTAPPVPAEILYNNARRDKDGGKPDLALAEFRDFLKYYPTSDLAPNCQYYIGEIHFSRNEFEDAVKDFDAVLEQYPKGSKTPDAYFYKGLALVKMGRSRDARKEFTSVIQQFPRTEAADKARSQMKVLGFNTPAKGKK